MITAALVVVTVVETVDATTSVNPDPQASTQVAALVAEVRDVLPRGDGVVEIRGGTTPGFGVDRRGHRGAARRRRHRHGVAPNLGFAYGADRVLGDERVRLVVLPVEDPDLAATRKLPCFEEAGRVHAVTLFLGDASCLHRSPALAPSSGDPASRTAVEPVFPRGTVRRMTELAPFDLQGTAAVVTGGGSGIGRAIATEFARRGAQVLVTDVDDARGRDGRRRDHRRRRSPRCGSTST